MLALLLWLSSPFFRAKFARITDPGLMFCGEEKTVDFLVNMTSSALRLQLKTEANDMCVQEWAKRGGLDGTLVCALCDSTPITYREGFWSGHLDCALEHHDGCYCNLDFYTSKPSKRTGRTLTLCEFCYEGEWTRFGRQVFEVVRPVQLYLLECAESVVWSNQQYDGDMVRAALGRGLEMVRHGIHWASTGKGALVTAEGMLRGRILEESFGVGEFAGAYRRRLREVGGLVGVGKNKGLGEPLLV